MNTWKQTPRKKIRNLHRFTAIIIVGAIITGCGGSPRNSTLLPGAVPAEYERWVLAAGRLCGDIPPAVIAAQIEAESNWDPNATSSAGAQGLAQFMPSTWPSWGQDDDDNGQISPFDPGDAIMAQGRFMCALIADMQSISAATGVPALDLALAAYNAGPGNVRKHNGIPPFTETRRYVAKIKDLIPKYAGTAGHGVPAGPLGQRIVSIASTALGIPYVWAGGDTSGPTIGAGETGEVGYDCSGLVLWAAFQASGGDIKLPHSSNQQAGSGTDVMTKPVGGAIDLSALVPGDIIVFAKSDTGRYHHVAIYVGDGQIIHAPVRGKPVQFADVTTSYYKGMKWTVRRLG